jgi:small subunit ribosomal protein S6
MVSKYELMIILNSNIWEEERTKSLESLKELLVANAWEIVSEDIWWDKKLAYKINKSETGFYVLFQLNLDGSKIKEINKTVNLDRNIVRYMFVKQEA